MITAYTHHRKMNSANNLLCAWLLALPAAAQQPTNPCNLPGPTSWYTDFLTTSPNTCAPWPSGNGTGINMRRNAAGVTVWWYCPRQDGSYVTTWRAATTAIMTPDFLSQLTADLATAAKSSDPTAALNKLTKDRIGLPLSDPSLTPVWCPWVKAMWTEMPPSITSPDGSLVPPMPSLVDAEAVRWTILANGFAARNGISTNGHATQILLRSGSIYVKSPTGGFWWKWLGLNQWSKLTTTQP